jgi:heme/copper-type cytochrome/quinol oxidase subunit 2
VSGKHTSRLYRLTVYLLILVAIVVAWCVALWLAYYVLMHLPYRT